MINHFKEKYPNLEVVLCEGTIKEVEDWLVSRVVDIGLLFYLIKRWRLFH